MKRLIALFLILLTALPLFISCEDADDKENKNDSTANISDYGTNLVEVDILNFKLTDYVTLGQYKGITYKPKSTELTEKEINTALDEFRNVPVADIEHEVKDGDVLVLDYIGTIDGVAFEGGTAEGTKLQIGSGAYIDGFETGLIGHKVGEKVVLKLKFPDNYGRTDLNGKNCQFDVTIQKVYKLQQMTDEFVKANSDYTTVEEYMDNLKKTLQEQKNAEAESEDFSSVWNVIKESTTLKTLPEQPIKNYYNVQLNYFERMAQSAGYTAEQFAPLYTQYYLGEQMTLDGYKTYLYDASKSYMKEIFILYAIAAKENLLTSRDDYFAYLQQQIDSSSPSGNAPTVIDYDAQLSVADRSYLVTSAILTPRVVDFIMKNAVKVSQ